MTDAKFRQAWRDYQVDPSPENRAIWNQESIRAGYAGIEVAEAFRQVAQVVDSYFVKQGSSWVAGYYEGEAQLTVVPSRLLPRYLNYRWDQERNDEFQLDKLVLIAWATHLNDHWATFAKAVRQSLEIIEKGASQNIRRNLRGKGYCESQGHPCFVFNLCNSCGKPQCVCHDFGDQFFGSNMAVRTHPLPELCDCHGGGYITTDYDTAEKCREHDGHHPECGEHREKVNGRKICDCGYAKRHRTETPCRNCGMLTTQFCAQEDAAICSGCSPLVSCPNCQEMVCRECLEPSCLRCKKQLCNSCSSFGNCHDCVKSGKTPDGYFQYCRDCFKRCGICQNDICVDCIQLHRSQPCRPYSWHSTYQGPKWRRY